MDQIGEFFSHLFDSASWPPRWHCGRWTGFHGWLYIISDLLIWSAYFTIPLVIIRYLSKKHGIRFVRLYFLFAAFILACGATHFLDAIAFWIPVYRLNALVLLITGALSWITVFYLVKLLPVAFSLRSQSELEKEIEQRITAETQIRKQADQALRESEQLLMAIVDNSAAVIYVKDLQGKYLLVNQRFCELFHTDKNTILGKTDHAIFPGAAADAFRAMDTRVVAANATLKAEEMAPHDDGLHTYISVKSTLKDQAGKPYAVFGVSTDITDIKGVESDLRKSIRELSDYKFALDESSIVAITDQKGIITHVNDNFCSISKYTTAELLGQDHRIINSGYHPKEFIRDLWVTIANGKIWKGELKNKAKDGSFYWVDTTIVPFLDERGKPYQYVAIRADITPRKKAEEELCQLNRELEHRVDLRTVQLEAANKEMEAFTYSVSHDLRAPLRGIIGFATMLEEEYTGKLDDEARRITAVIKKNTIKMGRLVDDLLAFSRMGRREINKTDVDMQAMVKEVIDDLTPAKFDRPIGWEVRTLPSVRCDESTIRQVWTNLLSNAIKYSGKKEHPHIGIGSFVQDGQTAFYVKDNGVGFDNRYGDKLFRVFQRLHSEKEFEGTGVGLALVMKIVSKHGGRVWAEGEIGQGACFYFSLP
jgi:PAS domain S-box-containing protein